MQQDMDVTLVLAQHVLHCQFSKTGRHRREPWKGINETNLSLGDPAYAFYWPQKQLLTEVRLWYSGARGQVQTVQTVEVQPQSPCCNSSTLTVSLLV